MVRPKIYADVPLMVSSGSHERTRSEVIRGCCFASPRISVQQKFSFL
jgi:hypothetical protein